jgi:hypothetical protein
MGGPAYENGAADRRHGLERPPNLLEEGETCIKNFEASDQGRGAKDEFALNNLARLTIDHAV